MSRNRRQFLPDFPDDFDKFEEELKIISQCPVCDTKFNTRQSQILEDKGNAHLVYLNCKKCLNSVLAVVRFDPQGISSIGMVTDLTEREVLKFKDGQEVSFDDVLLARQALNAKNWQGNFS